MRVLGVFIIVVFFFLLGCVKQGTWEQVQTVEQMKWNVNKTFTFEYPSTDTINNYNVYIDVRHAAQYKYSNLYIFVTTKAPNGRSIKDTLEFQLANTKGQWYGSGLSDIKELRLCYKAGIKFGQAGNYFFKIEQAMRDEVLQHITDIGVRIEKN